MTEQELISELCEGFLILAFARARPLIPSKTLQEAIIRVPDDPVPGQGYLEIPHYWAQYVHDGRGGMLGEQVPPSGVLIWFKDIRDDFRIAPGQTPERIADLRPLSAREYAAGLAMNRAARAAGVPPRDYPMIVRRVVFAGVDGAFFFDPDVGMKDMMAEYDAFADKVFKKYLKSNLPWAFEVQSFPAIARIG